MRLIKEGKELSLVEARLLGQRRFNRSECGLTEAVHYYYAS